MINVTSLAEVWIETTYKSDLERPRSVTSLAEVWIETLEVMRICRSLYCHFPCGSVD